MPNDGVQRGSIMKIVGDPLTPLYPAKPTIYKTRDIEKAKKDGIIPSIPALPISYTTAYKILSRMTGRPVPKNWQGYINVTYKTGPGFSNDETITIDVHSSLELKTVRNVIGYIRGRDEPDRYVLVGNHFDAWVYGSVDPNSGTAVLAEVARAMVQTMNETGWKPARSIVFNAWDAEEYSLIGSTEFVEEFDEILRQRAVVYINMDCLYMNHTIGVRTTPEFYQIVTEATKTIPNFSEKERRAGRTSLYDTFIKTSPRNDSLFPNIPQMNLPGGNSDHKPFLTYSGTLSNHL
ncbi:hypothetical protein WR25_25582 [Diploscapter pachys]|uniref:Peptidase M28 domain-containing protein n=1 Tax=Diploscapter pachys TaxID=2018661 RepID=A0A2A2LZQ8_9BILA|nr:hypothetical protein WR25_25582 [Diploscapter pachys]